jgi:hypothetical protein
MGPASRTTHPSIARPDDEAVSARVRRKKRTTTWSAAGVTLAKMDRTQVVVAVGGGNGGIGFSTANVTAQ